MKRLRLWFLAPASGFTVAFFLVPLAILLAYSFLTRGSYGGLSEPWTGENWLRLADPIYLAILWRSFVVAGISTLLCLILGFPLALFIARSERGKNLYLAW